MPESAGLKFRSPPSSKFEPHPRGKETELPMKWSKNPKTKSLLRTIHALADGKDKKYYADEDLFYLSHAALDGDKDCLDTIVSQGLIEDKKKG